MIEDRTLWAKLLTAHLRELADARRELAEIDKAVLAVKAEVGEDQKWRQDQLTLVRTRELQEDRVDLALDIRLHEDAVSIIRLYIEVGLPHLPELVPPPRVD